jgi:hypothetical protein
MLLFYLVILKMNSVTDIPLYDVIREIEDKHGEDTYMTIEAMLDDEDTEEFENTEQTEIPVEKLLWWCEFQDQVRVFDNIASVKDWFLNQVEKDPNWEDLGDKCFYTMDGKLIRDEQGKIIHDDDEFVAYQKRNPDWNSECVDCNPLS